MRRLLLVSMLLLITSCTQKPSVAKRDLIPLNEVFEHSERCPHVCWMSIKPGVTTMEEATTLLSASDQIDRESIEITEYGIAVKWYMGATSASFTTWVRIYASDNGADVKSITFVGLYPYTVKEFIDFLGEPDEIFIIIRNAPHGRYLDYALHYPSLNTFFYANPPRKNDWPGSG